MGVADFRVGGHVFATLASQANGFGNLMLTPDMQAQFVGDSPELYLPVAGGWGAHGHHAHPACRRGRAGASRRSPCGVESACAKERHQKGEATRPLPHQTVEITANACELSRNPQRSARTL